MNWRRRPLLVTGGASFTASHLTDTLAPKRTRVRVVDNVSSGKLENIETHIETGAVECPEADLPDQGIDPATVLADEAEGLEAKSHGKDGLLVR